MFLFLETTIFTFCRVELEKMDLRQHVYFTNVLLNVSDRGVARGGALVEARAPPLLANQHYN